MNWKPTLPAVAAGLLMTTLAAASEEGAPDSGPPENFQRENLVAWCIVPFDSVRRGPEERAEMFLRLGLRRVAFDWRANQPEEFEKEILTCLKHGIEFFAFWDENEDVLEAFRKHSLQPQIWKTLRAAGGLSGPERVSRAAEALAPLAERTASLGLPLGLYNHGGWGGLPANLLAVCEALHEMGHEHVGIVYNFHHSHARIAQFDEDIRKMMPYLLCINLNGMVNPNRHDISRLPNRIRPIGRGEHEDEMILTLINLGYSGPVGILGHSRDRDMEEILRENIEGLESILARIE